MRVAVIVAALATITLLFFVLRHKPRTATPTLSQTPTHSSHSTYFVFAKIFDTVAPIERAEKYEDPLDAMLHEQHLGEVTGGGTMQRKDKTIEYVGVDIELVNLDSALDATRAKLRELGAPKGSVLEFQRGGQNTIVPIHDN